MLVNSVLFLNFLYGNAVVALFCFSDGGFASMLAGYNLAALLLLACAFYFAKRTGKAWRAALVALLCTALVPFLGTSFSMVGMSASNAGASFGSVFAAGLLGLVAGLAALPLAAPLLLVNPAGFYMYAKRRLRTGGENSAIEQATIEGKGTGE